jgi:hypothetical protein
MGIATFPAGSSGLSSVVKSVQRGVAVSAGNVTITAVDTAKTQVTSFSTASTGTVAASGAISGATGATSTFNVGARTGTASPTGVSTRYGSNAGNLNFGSMNVNLNAAAANAMNVTMNAQNLSGGTTNLIAGVNGAYLTTSTNLAVTGACRYEIVEYF